MEGCGSIEEACEGLASYSCDTAARLCVKNGYAYTPFCIRAWRAGLVTLWSNPENVPMAENECYDHVPFGQWGYTCGWRPPANYWQAAAWCAAIGAGDAMDSCIQMAVYP